MQARIPQIKNIEEAIVLYYSKIEMMPKDIIKLFGCCPAKACSLKKVAVDYIIENNVPRWNASAVNTKAAYKSWGLDIDDLEKRYNKLKKMEMGRGVCHEQT